MACIYLSGSTGDGRLIESEDAEEDIYAIIRKMHTVQTMNTTSIAQPEIHKRINSDRIYLVGYGDLHIENLGTDLERIETELRIMSETPNLYVVFMGDLTDNSVKYLENNFDTYLTPKAARGFGCRIFDALGDKLICAIKGCHEAHSEEKADYDYVEEYCKNNHISFLNERGILTLELANEHVLNIALAHKAQGYSMYNPFHPAIRLIREHYPEADVVITAHQHQSGIAIQNEQGKPRAMITIGTRKQGDRYATRRGFIPQLPNKNLPVLQIIQGGYKILNDITLLKDECEKERERKIGNGLLKHVAKELNKNEENKKLKELKAKGFTKAYPESDNKEERITQKPPDFVPSSRALAEKEENALREEARKAKNRVRKTKYRETHREKYNEYARKWRKAQRIKSEGEEK